MARSFSKQEKENIKNNLMIACKENWTQFGYKKTSVDELCKQVGISKGAFYLFFESKESLFCDVLCSVQKEIYDTASAILQDRPDKSGVCEALKCIYRQYDKNNFLYDSSSTDFTILTNKLSQEQLEMIQRSNDINRSLFITQPFLTLKVDPDKAVSVIYSLIMNIKNKDVLPFNHIEVFDFMADCLIDDLYE